jgi:hypothetical protein
MKHIYIQDVPRQELERVVLDIMCSLDVCRWAMVDLCDANEHNVLTDDELYAKLSKLSQSFYDGVFRIFVKAGWLVKKEELGNE